MKKYYLPLYCLLLPLAFMGCDKRADAPKPVASTTPAVIKGTTGLPIGGADGSGVDPATGYTLLTKHYPRGQDGNFIYDAVTGQIYWDGSYDAPYYNVTLNIVICRYKNSPALGDPAYGYFKTPDGTGTSITGDCVSSFTMTVTQWIVTNLFPASSLTDFNNSLLSYFNGQSSTYPTPQNYIAGSSIVYRYGKLISISPGVYAIAELLWAPPAPACNALCQYCILHPNDPSCP